MTDNPLFSVLIANYNNGKYLMDAIESVYTQTYTNWEIILVDDGSTDNSKELYKELANDSRIHIFCNDKNRGCGYTKRRCAELANGEICGFLDPDDMLLPEAIKSHVDAHLERVTVSCVFSRFYFCDDKMNRTSQSRLLEIEPGKTYFTNKDYQPEVFASFKKMLYGRTEGIASDIKLGVDQDLYFKIEETGPVYILDKFTYLYRIHNKSISRDSNQSAFYWNLIVRHRTCMRRRLSPVDFPIRDFTDDYNRLKSKYEKQIQDITKSYSYRIGYFILTPFRFFKSILRKK